MKKIVLNISDCEFEKLRFEALHQEKSIQDILKDRIFFKPFHEEVLEAYDKLMENDLIELLKD